MESVHLTCPCCSEDVVLRYVSGYCWIYPPKIANISQIRVEIQGPQLQELRHVSCFWVNGPKKLQYIPQEIQENAGRVDMKPEIQNVSTFFCVFFGR